MPTKRNMKNCTLVEVIQPKDYMTLVSEKLDYHTKQLILNHISLMEIKEQAQETHKLRLWYCGNCKPKCRPVMKHTKTYETLFGHLDEKKAKKLLKDAMKRANRN